MRIVDPPTTEPSIEPVTVSECKLDARVDGTEFDTLLPDLITAARVMCEQQTGRRLITQTVRVDFDDWPEADEVIELSPVTSAVVTYWDGASWATLASNQYAVVVWPRGVSVLEETGVSWPTLVEKVGPRVRVSLVCGFGAGASSVPMNLRMWIRAHVTAMLDNPAAVHERNMEPLPYISHLLDQHRTWA